MSYLEDGPQHLVLFLAVMRRIFRIFHFIAKFEQRVLDVVEPRWWGFAVAGCTYRRHNLSASLFSFFFFLFSCVFFPHRNKRRREGSVLE